MSLRMIQEAFVAELRGSPDVAAPLQGCRPAGLAVYRHAYRAQLREALRDTFAATHAWLGEARFNDAAQAYIEAHPPGSWTLADYGDGFAASLLTRAPDGAAAGELAWLDWNLRRAFDGPDAACVTPEALATADWTVARLAFAPTLRLGALSWNTAAIWSALSEGRTSPGLARLPKPAEVRVWRADLTPRFCTIRSDESEALRCALTGARFSEICDRLAKRSGEAEAVATAGELLAAWVRDGLIAGVDSDVTVGRSR